jgi:hypothetical protein
MTKDQAIAQLKAQGLSATQAAGVAGELEKAGALPRADVNLLTDLVNSVRNNTGPSANTLTNVVLYSVERWEKAQGTSAPTAAPKTTKVGDAGGNVLSGRGSSEQTAYNQRVVDDAWRLLKGDWDPNVVPGQEVVKAATDLKNFLGSLPAQTVGETAGSDFEAAWNDLLGSFATGGSAGGGAGAGFEENPVDSPEEIDAYARQNYGYLAAYLSDPEIGPILNQAAREDWDEGRLRGALANTSWWKNTANTARVWDAEWNMDRATSEAKVQTQLESIRRQAALMGLSITGRIDLGGFGSYDRDYWLAVTSLREGWSPERLAQAIFNEGGFNANQDYGEGQIGAQADQVKRIAAAYMLPVSEQTANDYARKVILGELSLDGVEAMFRDQAKGRYPGMASVIDQGVRPEQYFDTYKQQIGQLLEIDPDSVNLLNGKWAPIVETVGQDGVKRPMTLSEAADYIRSQPEYDKTDNAMQEASRVGELLGKTFGRIG